MTTSVTPDVSSVRAYLLRLQDSICAELEQEDGGGRFREDSWERANTGTGSHGGGGRSRVLAEGAVFEKAGVGFSHVRGDTLPASATAHRPELAGKPWEALGVSLVIHPRNPYVPTSHANVRFFIAGHEATGIESKNPGGIEGAATSSSPDARQRVQTSGTFVPLGDGDVAAPSGRSELRGIGPIENRKSKIENPIWWFGGGFDLTPYYGFEDDAVHWHRTARDAVSPFGDELYPRFKQWCDDYFYLKHRNEPRGIGGLFFDDFNALGFDQSFELLQAVGNAFVPAYRPIVARRKAMAYGDRERQFQLNRRGRYVEFNLVWDRGTLFGLQTGGRTESILMSLPPLVRWDYDWHPEPGSAEAKLYDVFLKPRDWLACAR